jgi:hypothetical protein
MNLFSSYYDLDECSNYTLDCNFLSLQLPEDKKIVMLRTNITIFG